MLDFGGVTKVLVFFCAWLLLLLLLLLLLWLLLLLLLLLLKRFNFWSFYLRVWRSFVCIKIASVDNSWRWHFFDHPSFAQQNDKCPSEGFCNPENPGALRGSHSQCVRDNLWRMRPEELHRLSFFRRKFDVRFICSRVVLWIFCWICFRF